MSTTTENIIHLLPPELSNKIAAGEVVERPASVVKELLDNAIDSGADHIKITVAQAGRSLIQVEDNGCGMSADDIPLCFQRHATSKISTVDDLYNIHTLGFRGEAMASIASVSMVTLKTKRAGDDSGWETEVNGGEISELRPAASDQGTTVTVRNLFFNVPARRAFMKKDATELRHIIMAVQQAALANTDIAFELCDEREVIYKLHVTSLADRVASIFGKSYKASLIPVEESTSLVSVHGYLIDPQLSKKNRGEQFLFVNERPFLHRHLNYVIQSEYSRWTGKERFPFYVLFLKVDPARVDVNVHPTKLEVKFDDDRSISTFVRSIVKKALNERFSVPEMPDTQEYSQEHGSGHFSLDEGFRSEHRGRGLPPTDSYPPPAPGRRTDRFDGSKGLSGLDMMERLYPSGGGSSQQGLDSGIPAHQMKKPVDSKYERTRGFWQLHDRYIFSQTRSGMFIIDQYLAHMRIIYEKALSSTEAGLPSTQQLLFPQHVDFSASDFSLLKEVLPTLRKIGFNIQLLSGNSALVNGVPADLKTGDEKPIIESILQEYQTYSGPVKLSHREKLVMAFASKAAIPRGKKLQHQEMEALIDQLFACEQPYLDPLNRPTTCFIPLEDIEKRFRK